VRQHWRGIGCFVGSGIDLEIDLDPLFLASLFHEY
jgi:hypothetical protein